jgi:hypothetical protein
VEAGRPGRLENSFSESKAILGNWILEARRPGRLQRSLFLMKSLTWKLNL